jgi:hypothetical protein
MNCDNWQVDGAIREDVLLFPVRALSPINLFTSFMSLPIRILAGYLVGGFRYRLSRDWLVED